MYLFGVTALDETDVLDYGLMNGMDTRFWSAYAGYVLTKKNFDGYKYVDGGVCAAKGFKANGLYCGIKENPTKFSH